MNYKSYCLCRTLLPIPTIWCTLFVVFFIVLAIVLSLIPTYLPPRNLGNINTNSCMSYFLSFIFFSENTRYYCYDNNDNKFFYMPLYRRRTYTYVLNLMMFAGPQIEYQKLICDVLRLWAVKLMVLYET